MQSGGEIGERGGGEGERLKEKWEERSENVQYVSGAIQLIGAPLLLGHSK